MFSNSTHREYPNSINLLMNYQWPGNVRELENAMERALILSRGNPLTFSDLNPEIAKKADFPLEVAKSPSMNLDRVISKHISVVLELVNGKVEGKNGAAKILGINPGTLRNRMRKLGIPFGRKAT